MQASDGAIEWSLLQNQFDSYEKYSLLIKLVSVIVLSGSIFFDRAGIIIVGILASLWLQDAIWKTFQSRIEVRLLKLERFLADEQAVAASNEKPYQFNSDYLQHRGSGKDLIKEYLHQAIKPTVAFLHIALLVLIVYETLNTQY